MNKSKKVALIALASLSFSVTYATEQSDLLSPEGYWVQYDEDNDAGHGRPEGIIKSFFANNGTLKMKIVVPLMQVNNTTGEVEAPMRFLTCSGSINGFSYEYSNVTVQGLIFSANLQKKEDTAGSGQSDVYDHGGVLNPNDCKTYSSMVQVRDNGSTLFARAYMGSSNWNGWTSVGKNAHWKRISENVYNTVKDECGITNVETEGGQQVKVYPYQNADGTIKNQSLYEKCTNYPFDVQSPV